MDKKRSILNVSVSVFFKIILLFGALFARRALILVIGNSINGLASLFVSIVGFLTVAELGIGEAISFCMYRPIALGDTPRVAALYRLFKKMYLLIGGIILLLGLCITPFIPLLAKDHTVTAVNVRLTFLLTLASVAVTYLYGARAALLKAHKNNYIATTIHSLCTLLEYASQIIVVYLTESFEAYLICRIVAALINWLALTLITNKKYGSIIALNTVISAIDRAYIAKNTKALFMHKLGGALVTASDSIIISAFIGVELLGSYSNYTTFSTALIGIISLFFTPLTSVIGHLFAREGAAKTKEYFNFFFGLNFLLATLFFLGYYAVIDDAVAIFFSSELILDEYVTLLLTLNCFLQFLRKSALLFRDATGTFYNDRFKPFAEGVLNIILSILFVKLWGIAGVLLATVITTLLICYTVEPYVLHRHAFGCSAGRFYLINAAYIIIFVLLLVLTRFTLSFVSLENRWYSLLARGFAAVAVSALSIPCVLMTNRDFRCRTLSLFLKRKKTDSTDINS